MREMRGAAIAVVFFTACATPPPEESEVQATRRDVTASLNRQFDLVLAHEKELAKESDAATIEERARLLRLAAEIAIRIVRIDPKADSRRLVERIQGARQKTGAP